MDVVVASSQRLVADLLALVVGTDTGMVAHSVTLGPSDDWPVSADGDLPATVAVVVVDQPGGGVAEAEAVARFRARWHDAAIVLLRRTAGGTSGRAVGYLGCHAVPATVSPGRLVKLVQSLAPDDHPPEPAADVRSAPDGGWAAPTASLPRRRRPPEARGGAAAVDTPPAPLTDRESEVLGLLSAGLEGDVIAAALGISVHTVRTHLQNVMRKLDVRTRLQAVTVAYRQGLLRSAVWPVRGQSEGGVVDR